MQKYKIILIMLVFLFILTQCSSLNYYKHTWKDGDTLEKIAKKYQTSVLSIRRENLIIEPNDLQVGYTITIPTKNIFIDNKQEENLSNKNLSLSPSAGGITSSSNKDLSFISPSVGRITSSFGSRGARFHYGTDFGSRKGRQISASLHGQVLFIGRQRGYGQTIIIKHNENYKTLYAHLEKIYVKRNESITKGQNIGYMGNTGKSTGVHLHFEIHHKDQAVNPEKYIQNR